jgi:hypothetical protein
MLRTMVRFNFNESKTVEALVLIAERWRGPRGSRHPARLFP